MKASDWSGVNEFYVLKSGRSARDEPSTADATPKRWSGVPSAGDCDANSTSELYGLLRLASAAATPAARASIASGWLPALFIIDSPLFAPYS